MERASACVGRRTGRASDAFLEIIPLHIGAGRAERAASSGPRLIANELTCFEAPIANEERRTAMGRSGIAAIAAAAGQSRSCGVAAVAPRAAISTDSGVGQERAIRCGQTPDAENSP